ncbi:L,D-transpeptidase family protein [Clostridium sp. JNZ J1-5]
MKHRTFISLVTSMILTLCIISYICLREYTIKYYMPNIHDKNKYSILVDIPEKRLYLLDKTTNNVFKTYPIASGKDTTPTPLGTWKIINKSQWSGGFGTRWLGLNVPWGRYGIHGTNKPGSIGSSASHGCIRMLNKDVEDLYKYVDYGTIVVIYGGPYGPFGSRFRTLIPGDTGSDVYEVQRLLKDKGYYKGYLDGIYGEGMKECIVKFKKDNKLTNSHDIDYEFYRALGIKPFE